MHAILIKLASQRTNGEWNIIILKKIISKGFADSKGRAQATKVSIRASKATTRAAAVCVSAVSAAMWLFHTLCTLFLFKKK